MERPTGKLVMGKTTLPEEMVARGLKERMATDGQKQPAADWLREKAAPPPEVAARKVQHSSNLTDQIESYAQEMEKGIRQKQHGEQYKF